MGLGIVYGLKKAQLLNGVLRIQLVREFMTVVDGEAKEEKVHLQRSRRNVCEREREHVRWVRRECLGGKREENGSSVSENQPHLRAKETRKRAEPTHH